MYYENLSHMQETEPNILYHDGSELLTLDSELTL